MSAKSSVRSVVFSSLFALVACGGGGGGGASGTPTTGSAKLAWTAPTTNTDGSPLTDLSGYRIYYGTDPNTFSRQAEVNNPSAVTWTVSDLAPGTWRFAVTAVRNGGYESAYSNIVFKTIP